MIAECRVNDCFIHHDMENESINAKARRLADVIEYNLRFRNTFCNCGVEKYIISIDAKRVQTADFIVIEGCPHFYEHAIKAASRAFSTVVNNF